MDLLSSPSALDDVRGEGRFEETYRESEELAISFSKPFFRPT